MTFIEEYIATKALDKGLALATAALQKVKSSINSSSEDIVKALERHLSEVENWSSEVTFGDLGNPKSTTRVYVDLDCYVMPKYRRMSRNENLDKFPIEDLFKNELRHFVLIGSPGAGKTTTMKNLCRKILQDENFAPGRVNHPIVIRLRELNSFNGAKSTAIYTSICEKINLQIHLDESISGKSIEMVNIRTSALADSICHILDSTKALLILDGFDEITKTEMRESVLHQIDILMLRSQQFTIVLTSRTGEFFVSLEKANTYEICELGPEQISDFAHKWLDDETSARDFINQVNKSPFADSAMRPLTLAHLCALHSRNGSIPEKPKTVYRKIFQLLLTDWDEQRAVKRETKYSGFESDRKYEFLSHIAYLLTIETRSLSFTTRQLSTIYRSIKLDYGLPESEALKVVKEIEGHTGLFLQCGFDEFEFAHKSLQEFLTAEYLVRLPSIPNDLQILELLPNELAIAISISSNPSEYLTELALERINRMNFSSHFIPTFITRLIQEKVDFKGNEIVLLSLFSLYSKVVAGNDSNFREFGQLNLFMFDSMASEFELLVRSLLISNPEFNLEKYYVFESEVTIIGAARSETYKLRADAKHRRKLPKNIVLRGSFIKELRKANFKNE